MQLKIITSIGVEKNGNFLILKRSHIDVMPELWEFPSGKVEEGESLVNAAKRELSEETGLKAVTLLHLGHTERFSEDRDIQSNIHTVVHHFYCNRFDGEVKISEEHTQFKWITKNDLLRMRHGEDVGSDTIAFFKLYTTEGND